MLGALVLAALIARGARAQATAAAALGSVEDVAQLSVRISATLQALQLERSRAALAEGATTERKNTGEAPPDAATPPVQDEDAGTTALAALRQQYDRTDASLRLLKEFLAGRDLSKLPPRLARDLRTATTRVDALPAFRNRLESEEVPLDEILAFYEKANDALISTTAALTQLSDDGELLRRISSLVALSEVTERGSRQHALLSYIFAYGEFPPGSFKTLVTLATEQALFESSFQDFATEETFRRYTTGQETADAKEAIKIRNDAIAATDETVSVNPLTWFDKEAARLDRLADVERDIIGGVSLAATRKMAAIGSSIRTSIALSGGVIVASALMALVIARAITRSIHALSSAADRVQKTKDFAVRAEKKSSDELGTLTDTFNEMLAGIQARDGELNAYRTNLEGLVTQRTAELESRTRSMRLVLDNVDQGLATVQLAGTLSDERSRALEEWFGSPKEGESFASRLAGDDPNTRFYFEDGWQQVVDDILPLELTIDQLPKRIDRNGRHYTVRFKPIMQGTKLDGALLVVSDVTEEVAARAEQEKQREYIAVFEHAAHDRDGFAAFVADTNRLLERATGGLSNPREMMMVLHTLKGNTGQYGVTSVARIAHALESDIMDTGNMPDKEALQSLVAAWHAVEGRFKTILGDASVKIDLTHTELDGLIAQLRSGAPYEELLARFESLKHEPTSVRFERMRNDAEGLARRLGKPRPNVVIEHENVRLPASRFGPFWSSTVHILRNMLDHGVEPPDERRRAGKPEAGTLKFRSSVTADHFRVEFGDDGRGIDWGKIKASAAKQGRHATTRAELEQLLFSGGVSTAETVTEVSGRGVGLSAAVKHCEELGGTVSVESTPGRGTTFVFTFPRGANEHSLVPPASENRGRPSTKRAVSI